MIAWLRRRRTAALEPVGEVLVGYIAPDGSGHGNWFARIDRSGSDPTAAPERSEQVDREDRSPLPAMTSAPASNTSEWYPGLSPLEQWHADGER